MLEFLRRLDDSVIDVSRSLVAWTMRRHGHCKHSLLVVLFAMLGLSFLANALLSASSIVFAYKLVMAGACFYVLATQTDKVLAPIETHRQWEAATRDAALFRAKFFWVRIWMVYGLAVYGALRLITVIQAASDGTFRTQFVAWQLVSTVELVFLTVALYVQATPPAAPLSRPSEAPALGAHHAASRS